MLNTLDERKEFIGQLRNDIIKQFDGNDYQIWIFGSFLTDEYVPGESDIDIGIFCDNTSKTNDLYSWIDDYLK